MEIPEERLDQIFNALIEADGFDQMSAVLTPLTRGELRAIQEVCLDRFGEALAAGALERSAWVCGTLVINANQASICFHGMVLDAISEETERRKLIILDPPSCGRRKAKGQTK